MGTSLRSCHVAFMSIGRPRPRRGDGAGMLARRGGSIRRKFSGEAERRLRMKLERAVQMLELVPEVVELLLDRATVIPDGHVGGQGDAPRCRHLSAGVAKSLRLIRRQARRYGVRV